MKKKSKIVFIVIIVIVILLLLYLGYRIVNKNNHFIKINYDEIIEKVNNKDNFILCLSRTECTHCQSYKPKLKKIANKYNVDIHYVDVDTMDDKNYTEFKTKFSFDGGTPTTIFFKNGEEKTTATRIEGDVSEQKIIDKLKKSGFID